MDLAGLVGRLARLMIGDEAPGRRAPKYGKSVKKVSAKRHWPQQQSRSGRGNAGKRHPKLSNRWGGAKQHPREQHADRALPYVTGPTAKELRFAQFTNGPEFRPFSKGVTCCQCGHRKGIESYRNSWADWEFPICRACCSIEDATESRMICPVCRAAKARYWFGYVFRSEDPPQSTACRTCILKWGAFSKEPAGLYDPEMASKRCEAARFLRWYVYEKARNASAERMQGLLADWTPSPGVLEELNIMVEKLIYHAALAGQRSQHCDRGPD